jgi:poly(A) polymerase
MREAALAIVRRLQQAGHEAYWVGGGVRDMLRGVAPKDYDIATSARPAQVERLFRRTIPVGRKFGVVLVLEHGHTYEVATFRSEGDYLDGRRPQRVDYASARADAGRRDFTVNGLFYDPVTERLLDWVNGEPDLRAGVLRTIGDPRERFAEDHLRLLRAVRFAAQLGFRIEPRTWRAVQDLAATLRGISAERIRDELNEIFRAPHAARGLQLLQSSGLLAQVLPELEATVDCAQSPEFHPEGSVFHHLVKMLGYLPADCSPWLPWAALLHDVGKPLTASRHPEEGGRIRFSEHERVGADLARAILDRLRFPRKFVDAVTACVRYHMQFKDAPAMRRSTLRRMLLRPTFPVELELHRLDCLGSHGRLDAYEFLRAALAELESRPALRPPLLTGDDLIDLGMHPGPELGAMLRELRERQLQDELRSRRDALRWVAQRLADSEKSCWRSPPGSPTAKGHSMAKPLTKSQIAASIAETAGITKKQAVAVLETLKDLAYKNAKNSFTLPGLGKLVLVKRKARTGRNPATGEAIKIPAKRVVKFRVAKAAKDAILGAK